MAIQYLSFMRHAKSSWSIGDLSDHERPLNKRGRAAAGMVGQYLRAKSIYPKTIWSSDSARTKETAARAFTDHEDIEFIPEFYHAGANTVLYQCEQRGEPESQDGRLLLLGHNPGWEELVWLFSGRSTRMPTGACAVFKRTKPEGHWLEPDSWRLQDLILPRDLEE